MAQVVLSDTELLDELQRMIAERGVLLRSCRSGAKIELGFVGYGPVYTFFGGETVGELRPGVSEYKDYHTEVSEDGTHCGNNIRALLTKAVTNDRKLRNK